MKIGIISIIVVLIGILFVIWFNLEIVELFESEILKMENQTELNLAVFTTKKLNKIIALGIALIGIILGIKSLRNKNRIGIIGIILSVVLIILTFLPIWTYILSDSALDINFNN
jgi:threonine/homoserine efflux transporter RhtA